MKTHISTPALTPALLAAAADGPLAVTAVYGYQLRDAHGCHGSDVTAHLLSARPATYTDVEAARTDVTTRLRLDTEQRSAAARDQAGTAPVFDDDWPGTRGEYDTALRDWAAARDAAAATQDPLTAAAAWASHGFELVDLSGVVAANNEYRDGDELTVLGHEKNRYCMCGHSGTSLDTPDDLDLDDPDDAQRCDPRRLTHIVAGPWRWLTDPDVLDDPDPGASARARLHVLVEAWQTAIRNHAATLADLEDRAGNVPTEKQLARMRPAEYRAAVEARKAAGGLTWKLRDARTTTHGILLDKVSAAVRVIPVVPGAVDRNPYGWRKGPYRTVAEEVCRTPDAGTGRSAFDD